MRFDTDKTHVRSLAYRMALSAGLSLLCAVLLSSAASAQTEDSLLAPPNIRAETPLDGEALLEILNDRTHRGYYEFLRKPDGEYAFTEHVYANGTSLHIRDGVESKGIWRVKDNVVCFDYGDLNGGCFTIYKRANCYYPYSIRGKEFVAVLTLDDAVATCEPSVV